MKKHLRQQAQAVLNALDCPDAELSVVLVDDDQISALNATWFQRQGPTNVIAFPLRRGDDTDIFPHILGDVVISVETAAREARAAGMARHRRISALLIHGILHLLGYDHENAPEEAALMEAKASELLGLIEGRAIDLKYYPSHAN